MRVSLPLSGTAKDECTVNRPRVHRADGNAEERDADEPRDRGEYERPVRSDLIDDEPIRGGEHETEGDRTEGSAESTDAGHLASMTPSFRA